MTGLKPSFVPKASRKLSDGSWYDDETGKHWTRMPSCEVEDEVWSDGNIIASDALSYQARLAGLSD